jgi:hypothetical protein
MNGRGLTMIARVAVLVLAGGLAGCVVDTVDEPDGEAELGLVEGGGEAGAIDVEADEDQGAPDEPGALGLEIPAAYSTPTRGEEVTGEPFPDPWDIGDPDPSSNPDPDSDDHKSLSDY